MKKNIIIFTVFCLLCLTGLIIASYAGAKILPEKGVFLNEKTAHEPPVLDYSINLKSRQFTPAKGVDSKINERVPQHVFIQFDRFQI